MKKKNITLITEASLATVAGLALTNNHMVKAETAKSNGSSVVQKNASESKHETLAAQVNTASAKAELANLNNQVSAAQAKVDQSSQNFNSVKANFDNAQQAQAAAQTILKQANPERIAGAKQNVADQQSALNKSQQALKLAQSAARTAQQKLSTANNNNQAAKAAVAAQEGQIAAAQANLNAIKNNDGNSQAANAQQAFDQASREVATQQAQVADASKKLTANQKVLDTFKANAEQAQNAKSSSDADLAAAQKATNAAQAKQNAAANAQKQAAALVNSLNHGVVNHFVLNDAYIQTIHNAQIKRDELEKQKKGASVEDQIQIIIKQEKLVDDPAFMNAIRTASDQLWQANRYVASEADKNEVVDFDHLSAAQLLELNKFTVGLLNDARTQVGSTPLLLNRSAMKFAEDVKDEYQNNNQSHQNGHYMPGLQRAAEKSGLEDDGQFYENMGGFDTRLTPLKADSQKEYRVVENRVHLGEHQATMDEVKHNIYNGLKQMLFADNEWEHMTSLLSTIHNSASGPVYFGTSFSVLPGSPKISTHYELIKEKYIKDPAKFNKNDNITLTDDTDHQAQITDANADLTAKNQELAAANDALTKAQQAQAVAQKKADDAASYLASVNKMVASSQNSVEQSRQALAAAQEKLAAANAAKDHAAQVLAGINQPTTNKTQVLAEAQKALDKEVLAMAPLKADLNQTAQVLAAASQTANAKKQAVVAAQKQVTISEQNLQTAQTNLNNLVNAAKIAKQANADFAKAQADLAAAQKQLQLDQATLAKVQVRQKAAQEKYNQAQQALDHENMLQQVKDEQNRLTQEETVAPHAQILQAQDKKDSEYQATLFIPVLHHNLNWKVRVLDDQGHYIDKYVSTNKNIKVLAKKTVNGKTFYKIGDNEWIPAQFAIEANKEYKFKGIAYIPRLKNHPTWKVAMMDSEGHYTGKYLKTNSHWIVWGKKVINGKLCYRLGTQAQWVPAEYLVLK